MSPLMKKRLLQLAIIDAAVLLALVVLLFSAGRNSKPTHHPSGDVDKKADCWARPDAHGHRHCSSRKDGR